MKSRTNLQHHKIAFAQDCEAHATLLDAVDAVPDAAAGTKAPPLWRRARGQDASGAVAVDHGAE